MKQGYRDEKGDEHKNKSGTDNNANRDERFQGNQRAV